MSVDSSSSFLVKKRNSYKGRIVTALDLLKSRGERLSRDYFQSERAIIEDWLASVNLLSEQICDRLLEEDGDESVVSTDYSVEVEFAAGIRMDLFSLASRFDKPSVNPPVSASNVDRAPIHHTLAPKLNCPTFDASSLDADKFAFKNFLSQFENCVMNVASKSLRLQILKNHLSGYAFQIVEPLTISEENYQVALDLLTEEFLDRECIVDAILEQIFGSKPTLSEDFSSVKHFLTKVKADLLELKNSFNIDCLEEGSSGHRVMSYVIFAKLPGVLRREIIRTAGSNYPSLGQIFASYNSIIRTFLLTKPRAVSSPVLEKHKKPNYSYGGRAVGKTHKKDSLNGKPTTLENFRVESKVVRYKCNFCMTNEHISFLCKKYVSLEERLARCKTANLCTLCTSRIHPTSRCPGKTDSLVYQCWQCNSRSHSGALCPVIKKADVTSNVCYQSRDQHQDLLLPIMSIRVIKGGNEQCFNCLLDTGSQRSYLSSGLLNRIGYKEGISDSKVYDVNTFLGSVRKSMREVGLSVVLSEGAREIPFLIDDDIDMKFTVPGLSSAVRNFSQGSVRLAVDFSSVRNDTIHVHGLVGVDLLQYLHSMKLIKFLNGYAWEVPQGIIPFGNVEHFQLSETSSAARDCMQVSSYQNIISQYSACPVTHVNFVMNPKADYLDPCQTFEESSVERKLDMMFSLESLGLKDDNPISSFDKSKIDAFRDSIVYENDAYYVELPWEEDKIKSVPSNYNVSLGVLDRVVTNLTKKQLYEDYCKVFLEQEKEGFIERCHIEPAQYKNYIWIPHRPVFKNDCQSTTKIRPVFNCSLKTGGCPSLNEAAYPGINLFTDMLDLLLKFRTDRYVLLADVRKAFLMIRLKKDSDKNKFCFFLKLGQELVCFRYNTLIFGFVASPFILNYVLKHHLSKYEENACIKMLSSHFYVDNLVKTHNSPDELLSLYQEAGKIMLEGNFLLRSCNSNNELLRSQMEKDGSLVVHNSRFEKVLGYLYDPNADKISVSCSALRAGASTKREILSQNSSVFDPLSLCLPITIKGRLLLRELWKLKLGWDAQIPAEYLSVWNILFEDLMQLNSLEFPRHVVDSSALAQLVVFCDASQKAYGFAAYMVQGSSQNLIFAKSKVAPLASRTLPTLELLSVYLALKCLPSLLESYPGMVFSDISVAVDAQIVLSWVLSDTLKTKNQFVKNRLKDIKQNVGVIKEKYLVDIRFRYVPTSDNPADLITRGIALKKFKTQLGFWLHGPAWLAGDCVNWPISELNCLNADNRMIVLSNAIQKVGPAPEEGGLIGLKRYSSFAKLMRVATYLFRFVNRLKKHDRDPALCAKLYLLKHVQSLFFPEEKQFLLNPQGKQVPHLVADLNLFIDAEGLIRTQGRIGKTEFYDYEVLYPILLPRNSHFTYLIILNSHSDCKHLGIAATLNRFRLSGFWVPRARQAVKTAISSCSLCRKYNSISFRYPKVTNLPKHRVNLIRPFLHTGVDFTGHLWIRTESGDKKVYLLLFTCLSVRAVHLELIEDMSTHSFVSAMIRFVNIYGIPTHLYSDNARSFVAGSGLFERMYTSDEFSDRLGKYNIKHLTIPMYSPWFGSVWERLIKTVKLCLYKSIGRGKVDYFDLLTEMSDIQNAVNSRPLTYRCSSDSGLEVITPNSFIRPNYNGEVFLRIDEDVFMDEPPARTSLVEALDSRDLILKDFRKVWHQEYLLSLREQSKDLYQNSFHNIIQVDDVVLVKNPAKSRPYWYLGRVLELVGGDDESVRSVKLRRSDGGIHSHSLKHLYPLELSLTHSHRAANPPNENANEADTPVDQPAHQGVRCDVGTNGRPQRRRRRRSVNESDFLWY